MGYNRGGARRNARLKRHRREEERLAKKAEKAKVKHQESGGSGKR
jgi:hypothetical protein